MMDGWMDVWMDQWMDGPMDGQTNILMKCTSIHTKYTFLGY